MRKTPRLRVELSVQEEEFGRPYDAIELRALVGGQEYGIRQSVFKADSESILDYAVERVVAEFRAFIRNGIRDARIRGWSIVST